MLSFEFTTPDLVKVRGILAPVEFAHPYYASRVPCFSQVRVSGLTSITSTLSTIMNIQCATTGSPERQRQLSEIYTQVILDLKNGSIKDLETYLLSARTLEEDNFETILSALVNSAKEEECWPKIRDGGGVKQFIDLATAADLRMFNPNVIKVSC